LQIILKKEMKRETKQILNNSKTLLGQTVLENTGLKKMLERANPMNKNSVVTQQLIELMEVLSKNTREEI